MNNDKYQRNINVYRILRVIWMSDGISRIKIAEQLNLDKSTVTNIVSSLLEMDLVKIKAEGTSGPQGGRKPIFLEINKNRACIAGVEIQADYQYVVILNLQGEVIFEKSMKNIIFKNNFKEAVVNIYKELVEETEKIGIKLIGMGVGVSGIVNPHEALIYRSITMNIKDPYDFYEEVASEIDIPVFIENDANCCCWGELARRKKDELQNFIFVFQEFRELTPYTETYVGAAISLGIGLVINGKVYYGKDYSAGEFKSILWNEKNRNQFSISDEEMDRIRYDKNVFLKVLDELSANLALIINTFNLSHIFLGGFIKSYENEVINSFKKQIEKNWTYHRPLDCVVEFTDSGSNMVSYGAAAMLLERLFSIPDFNRLPLEGRMDRVELLSYISDNESK